MTVFTVSLAGVPIRIHAMFPELKGLFQDYLSTEEPAFEVAAERADLAREKQVLEKWHSEEPAPDCYCEKLAVSRMIADRLPDYDAIQFFGSVVAYDGKAYLFAAPSGTGKTTHALLWLRELPEASILTDDKPFLKLGPEGRIWAWGAPWRGKEQLGRNESQPLEAICLLKRADQNVIERISPAEASIPLMKLSHIPQASAARLKTVRLLDRICSSVRLYRMGCRPEPAAARLSTQVLLGKDRLENAGAAGVSKGFEHG